MITLIHKKNQIKTYELNCSVKGERVLTMLPHEHKKNLPDAVLHSPAIKTAIESNYLAYKVQPEVKAKPAQVAHAKEEAKKLKAEQEAKAKAEKESAASEKTEKSK